jgi:DNA-binding LacI/PurR family transcriptional regulator
MSQLPPRTVALICDPERYGSLGASPYWRSLVECARNRLQARGAIAPLHFTTGRKAAAPFDSALMQAFSLGKIDGVLAAGIPHNADIWLRESELPVVSAGLYGAVRADVDYQALVRLGVRNLRLRGCRRIGLWRASHGVTSGDFQARADSERAAFEQEIRAQGLEFDPAQIEDGSRFTSRFAVEDLPTWQEQGYLTARAVFSRPREQWPDGIVINEDMFALGCLMAMQVANIHPGEDIHIAAHTNRNTGTLMGYEDRITRLEVDPNALAACMISLLDDLFAQRPCPPLTYISPSVRPPGK